MAELITLPERERAHSFVNRKDVRQSPGQEVPLGGAEQCGPQPSRVELRELRLRAEGGGTLEAPRSELFVDVTLRNHGATQRGCHRVVLRLLDDSGQPLAPEASFVNDRTGTERSRELRFSFPRTRREVLLQVGTADEPGTTFVLELVGGSLRPR